MRLRVASNGGFGANAAIERLPARRTNSRIRSSALFLPYRRDELTLAYDFSRFPGYANLPRRRRSFYLDFGLGRDPLGHGMRQSGSGFVPAIQSGRAASPNSRWHLQQNNALW